jgi:hypothetical protein
MAKSAPPTPANVPLMMNDISLYRKTSRPTNATRCSFCPSASNINPYGELRIRWATATATTVSPAMNRYNHSAEGIGARWPRSKTPKSGSTEKDVDPVPKPSSPLVSHDPGASAKKYNICPNVSVNTAK